jgi:hypothetical protein
MIRFLSLAAVLVLFAAVTAAPDSTVSFTVTGGKQDAKNVLVTVPVPGQQKGVSSPAVTPGDGTFLRAQFAPARLLLAAPEGKSSDPPPVTSEITVLIPELKAGQALKLTGDLSKEPGVSKNPEAMPRFAWKDADGLEELRLGDRSVLRYFHKPFDAKLTDPKNATGNPTSKPYHHLFAPDGKTIVTNAADGMYPHHRGIFFGFNNISYGGKKADVWHCRNNEHTEHVKVLASEAGPLFGRQTLQIAWLGTDGKEFASERRELTAYNVPGGTMIDFASVLTTTLDKVRLDGDPQHAGFHFRASAAMEKNTKETFFIRPDGKGKPGEEKNWTKDKGGPVNLPWDAMSFVLDGKRYTVVYLDHPDNPKEARQSERCYGRIGTYFEYDLTPTKPLRVRYRLWFQEGEPTVEQCAALSQAFIDPPKVKVVP